MVVWDLPWMSHTTRRGPWAEELGTSVTRMTAWPPVGGGRAASPEEGGANAAR